jgi:hypothetical protein
MPGLFFVLITKISSPSLLYTDITQPRLVPALEDECRTSFRNVWNKWQFFIVRNQQTIFLENKVVVASNLANIYVCFVKILYCVLVFFRQQAKIIFNNTKEIYNRIFSNIQISICNSHLHVAAQYASIIKRLWHSRSVGDVDKLNIVDISISYASFCYSVLRDCVNMDKMIK